MLHALQYKILPQNVSFKLSNENTENKNSQNVKKEKKKKEREEDFVAFLKFSEKFLGPLVHV